MNDQVRTLAKPTPHTDIPPIKGKQKGRRSKPKKPTSKPTQSPAFQNGASAMAIHGLVDRLQNTANQDLPVLKDLKAEIIHAMNSDFCLAYAGTTPVLVHDYGRTADKPFRATKITTDGYLDFTKAIPYKVVKADDHGNMKNERKQFNGFKFWLESTEANRKQVIKFDPSTTEDDGDYNLWQGFPVEGVTVAHCPDYPDTFKQYVTEALAPNEPEAAEYLINWLAHLIQKPWSKPGVAVAVNSRKKGTGKSILGEIMRRLCGRHYMRIASSKQLLGQFTGHLSDKVFVNAEESCFVGDQKANDALKSLITSETQYVESKNKDAYEVDSYTRLYITSNHAHFVQASADERRFLILNNDESKHHQDTTFFSRVALVDLETGQAHADRARALFKFLLNRDISEFDVRKVPETEEMRAQKELSLTPIEAFVRAVMQGHYTNNLIDPQPFEYWFDEQQGEVWFKKDCMHERFKAFQIDAYHASKRVHIAQNKMMEAIKSTGLFGLHIHERQGGRNNPHIKRGSGYFVFDHDG